MAQQPSYLRSFTTVHSHDIAALHEELWRKLLPNWTFLRQYPQGSSDPRLEEVLLRLNPEARAKARLGTLLLLEDVDRPSPNECLISLSSYSSEVGIRIFGRYLTDIQSTSEWFVGRLLAHPEHFVVTAHTRCFVLLDVHGERTDLTTGRVLPQRHRLWSGFYGEYGYNINITALVIVLSLAVMVLGTPSAPYSPEGKFYGICERILSAAIMNAFLLTGQF